MTATNARDASESLHLALRYGVARLLRLEELLLVLNACSLLRRDAALVRQSVAETADFGWFPEILTDIAALASDSRRLHRLWGKVSNLSSTSPATGGRTLRPNYLVHVAALAAFLQKRVMHWCFVYEPLTPAPLEDVLCSVRPALIPINDYDLQLVEVPSGGGGDAHVSERLRAKLNAMSSSFGDAFTGLHKRDIGSRFGSHWDNIRVNQASDQIECTLCLAAAYSVTFYRRQVALFIERYNQKLLQQQYKWVSEDGKTASEVEALTEAFRVAHFPEGAYIAWDSERWSSAMVLQHVCRHNKFQFEGPFGSGCSSSVRDEDLLASLSPKNHRQCWRFYQPLKEQLLRRLKFVGRAQLLVARKQDDLSSSVTAQPRVVEFIGGVDAVTGALCGVYCSFR